MDPIKTSVIIVNFNGGTLLADCVRSVRQNTSDYEILLIDNASRDNSLSRIENGSDLRIFRLTQNLGFSRANNIGIRASFGEYVVLLNSDTRVTKSWLDNLIAIANRSQDIGLVTPKLLRPSDPPLLDSTGHVYNYRLGLPHDRGQGEVDAGQYDNATNVFSSCLACTLIKRKVFEDVGLLDESMFFYFEDVDFGFRARISGWQVVYCPRSIVYHLRGGSTGGRVKDEVWFRARPYLLRIMLKNYQSSGLLQYGSRRVLLDLLRVAAGIKNRDRAYSQNYAFEIWWNLLHPPIKERIAVQQRRKVPDRIIMKSL